MKPLLMRGALGVSLVGLIVTSAVGVYRIALAIAPQMDTSILTLLVIFVPFGLLFFTQKYST